MNCKNILREKKRSKKQINLNDLSNQQWENTPCSYYSITDCNNMFLVRLDMAPHLIGKYLSIIFHHNEELIKNKQLRKFNIVGNVSKNVVIHYAKKTTTKKTATLKSPTCKTL